jgi:glycosyltransferase involved in cell wall biosynthesis
MNVLVVLNCKGPFSVYEAQIEMISSLKDKGIQISVTGSYSDQITTIFKERGIDFATLHPKSKIDPTYIKEIKQYILDKNIDILHVLDGKALRNCIRAVKKENVKLITYFGSASLHWHDLSSYLTYLNPRVDKIICNSKYVFDHVRNQLFGKNKNKPIKIFKGYNPNWFNDIPSFDLTTLGIPNDSIVVAFAGTNMKLKRIPDFIKSSHYLSTHKKVHYIIMGKETDKGNLVKYKNESPIKEKIHILGLQPNAVSIIKASDIYVQTSTSEGFGRAISEAMSVGKPIVMTNGGGCTELIDEKSGVVVPVGDYKAIGKEISKIVNDDALRAEMGNNAKERMINLYHLDTTVEETYKLYVDILAK